MAKLTPLAVIAVAAIATLAACSTPPQSARPPSIVTNEMPYQSGSGMVTAVTPAPISSGGASSAPLNRLHVRMDSGTMQYVDTVSSISKGSRVWLTEDRQIRLM